MHLLKVLFSPVLTFLDWVAPIIALFARIWISWTFFQMGLAKLHQWKETLLLFQYTYHVPLLSPHTAAVLATAGALILPLFIVLGLGSRVMIFLLFFGNLCSILFYSDLLKHGLDQALSQHINWAAILGLLMCYGYGSLSFDTILARKFGICRKHMKQTIVVE